MESNKPMASSAQAETAPVVLADMNSRAICATAVLVSLCNQLTVSSERPLIGEQSKWLEDRKWADCANSRSNFQQTSASGKCRPVGVLGERRLPGTQ